jgi:hypothetical protein
MNDPRELLVALDAKLGRGWAKVEILLGLLVWGAGLFLGVHQVSAKNEPNWLLMAAALALFVLGGYLASAGHRSHLYRWSNRNTVILLDEIRHKGQSA